MLLLRYPQLAKDNLLDCPSHQDQTAVGHVDQGLKEEQVLVSNTFIDLILTGQTRS